MAKQQVISQDEVSVRRSPSQNRAYYPMPLYSANLVGLSAVIYSSHDIHNLNHVRVVHHVHDLIQVERSNCLIGSVVQLFASDFVGSIFYSLLFPFNPRRVQDFGGFLALISMAFLISNLESFNKAIITIVHGLDFPFFFFIFLV